MTCSTSAAILPVITDPTTAPAPQAGHEPLLSGFPVLLTFPPHRLARRVLRLEPHLRWPAAIGRVRPLRYDALQPHAADMLEHGRTVTCQVLAVPDGSRPGLASLASRCLRSISGKSRRSSPSCSIRSKANSTASWLRRRPVVAGNHDLAIDQERLCLEASGGSDNSQEAVSAQSCPLRVRLCCKRPKRTRG